MICASSTSSAPSSDAQYWVNFPECEREHKYTLLGTWAVHQTLSACTKTLAAEVVMALLSRGSREAGKGLKLEEWKEKKRSRNLRGDAIKKPVLNYRSPLPQHTWVNPWFQKVWTIGSASMIYRSNIIYYLLIMFPTGCNNLLGKKDEEGVSSTAGGKIAGGTARFSDAQLHPWSFTVPRHWRSDFIWCRLHTLSFHVQHTGVSLGNVVLNNGFVSPVSVSDVWIGWYVCTGKDLLIDHACIFGCVRITEAIKHWFCSIWQIS